MDELDNIENAEHRENELRHGFSDAVGRGDANALADWAPTVIDWEAALEIPPELSDGPYPQRVQTLAECMSETLDYTSGPSTTELMQLVLNATRSTDTELALMAGELVDHMCATFARNNA